jgi:hypothetical protein
MTMNVELGGAEKEALVIFFEIPPSTLAMLNNEMVNHHGICGE